VTVIPEPGRNAYPGVTRNGITSRNWDEHDSSFRFEMAAAPVAPAAAPVATAPAATTASVCPDNFDAFAGTKEPLACTCTKESVQAGIDKEPMSPLYGMDTYTADSPVCLAAVHAGAISPEGGPVTVIPEVGRDAYPGVTRNGISSRNWGKYDSSFRFEIAAVVAPATEPLQQPIAETIEKTGEVQLYVTFGFNSAELDPSAEPTLTELRDTLESSPQLRLALIGHTDAIGSADYNRDLSLRRARSVMRWLTEHGITEARLSADGKGFDEPIASNDTEAGRAQNRRVQALRL
jgi:outer membrane protein OmpA-like peptidoglycan-associated protein